LLYAEFLGYTISTFLDCCAFSGYQHDFLKSSSSLQ
jgi:hypothetical protein